MGTRLQNTEMRPYLAQPPINMRPTITFQFFLLREPRLPENGDEYERLCALDDGYAVFFSNLFKSLSAEEIKEYFFANGAIFGNDGLRLLTEIIKSARKQVEKEGPSWDVLLWTDRKKKPVYGQVTKEKMTALLDEISAARRKAYLKDGYIGIDFFGEY